MSRIERVIDRALIFCFLLVCCACSDDIPHCAAFPNAASRE
jgi:hypothetical protein